MTFQPSRIAVIALALTGILMLVLAQLSSERISTSRKGAAVLKAATSGEAVTTSARTARRELPADRLDHGF